MGAKISRRAKIMAAVGSLLLVITNKFPMFDILLVAGWDTIWVNYVYDVWLVGTVVVGTIVVVYFGTMEGEDVNKYKKEIENQNKMIAELKQFNEENKEINNPQPVQETSQPQPSVTDTHDISTNTTPQPVQIQPQPDPTQ